MIIFFLFQGQQYAIIGNLKAKKPVNDPNHIVYNGEIHSCQHCIADTSTQTASTTQLTQGTCVLVLSAIILWQ